MSSSIPLLESVADPSLHDLILAIEQADSSVRLISAVRALTNARLEAGIPTLIQVLGYNNPGAAITAVSGLVQLGEVAVQPLLEQIDGYNYGARAYSIRALAAIANPQALSILLEAAETDFAPSVRRAAVKGLGYLHWQQLSQNDQSSAQAQALKVLLNVSHDLDWAIRYAAVVGLQALAKSFDRVEEKSSDQANCLTLILTRFEEMVRTDLDPATKARALMAQQHLSVSSSQLAVSH